MHLNLGTMALMVRTLFSPGPSLITGLLGRLLPFLGCQEWVSKSSKGERKGRGVSQYTSPSPVLPIPPHSLLCSCLKMITERNSLSTDANTHQNDWAANRWIPMRLNFAQRTEYPFPVPTRAAVYLQWCRFHVCIPYACKIKVYLAYRKPAFYTSVSVRKHVKVWVLNGCCQPVV